MIVLEMLEDRNFIIEDKHQKNITIFAKEYQEQDDISFIFNKEKSTDLYFSIMKQDKITKKDLIKHIDNIKEKNHKIENILILCLDKQLLNYIIEFRTKFQLNLEIFLISNMQLNISKHELVPKHILLTDEEKKVFLETNGYKESELPRIKLNDPMTLYYNGKVGDVFKIIRENMNGRNKTSGQGFYYRIVID
tara:strand:+ start:247 stop:825 length:579 start_codon:yes stop_codon:yes gene_type:complete